MFKIKFYHFNGESPVFRNKETKQKITEFGKKMEFTEFHRNAICDDENLKYRNTV